MVRSAKQGDAQPPAGKKSIDVRFVAVRVHQMDPLNGDDLANLAYRSEIQAAAAADADDLQTASLELICNLVFRRMSVIEYANADGVAAELQVARQPGNNVLSAIEPLAANQVQNFHLPP